MLSSIFVSEKAHAGSGLLSFMAALIVLLTPYEALVRASERKWGVKPARIARRQSSVPHIDMFLEDVAAGVHYRAIAVGTSRVENGIAPEAMDPIIGPSYNLGVGLGSSVAMMEFLEERRVQPDILIVGVSPMDFTQHSVDHGRKEIALRHAEPVVQRQPLLDRWTRSAVYALLHSATPERRRNLGQWLQFRRDGGEVLAFLNNEDATTKPDPRQTHGFYPMSEVISQESFLKGGQRESVLTDYANQHAEVTPLFVGLVRRFRARGTAVILLHMPTTPGMQHGEDSGTTFQTDILAVSRACGAPYVDGNTLSGAAFLYDRFSFADTEHLNETGAMRFSRVLAERLRAFANADTSLSSGPRTIGM